MKTMLVALAVLTFGVSGLHAEEKAETKVEKKDGKKNESPVVKLNKDNFDKTIKSGLVLVERLRVSSAKRFRVCPPVAYKRLSGDKSA